MKTYFKGESFLKGVALLSLLILFTACGGMKDNNDPNLTPLQNQAVTYVKKHLAKGDKLIDYKVVEEIMPAAIIEQPFLQLRNTVFKAGLDYQSCKTRGLEKGMEMAEEKLENARTQILSTKDMIDKNMGGVKSLIVLARVDAKNSISKQPQSLIVVFDPETMNVKEWLPVTAPVQNTVALVVCAEDNTLSEYAKEQNHQTEIMAGKVSDPVLKFVLEAKAL